VCLVLAGAVALVLLVATFIQRHFTAKKTSKFSCTMSVPVNRDVELIYAQVRLGRVLVRL